MFRVKHAVIAAALLSVIALAVACSDDVETDNNAQQSDVDTLTARVDRNEMLFAYISIGGIELHAIDETLNDGGAIEESYVPEVRKFVRLMRLTEWDSELAEEAETVRQSGISLLAALQDADVEAAQPLATDVHEGSHDFMEKVFGHIAEDLPPEEGGPEEHEEEAEESPAAGETPAADHDEEAEETPAADETPQ